MKIKEASEARNKKNPKIKMMKSDALPFIVCMNTNAY